MSSSSVPQSVSALPAAALVVSNMIGVGVFTSLGYQIAGFTHANGTLELSGSVFPLMMLWVIGGFLALSGALCYAELATALPRSGGEYHFLSRIYHPMVGFCTGLCSATVGFSAPTAASALLFGEFLTRAFPELNGWLPFDPQHTLAAALILLATLAHLRSIRFTGGFQAATTLLTLSLILAFIFFGFITTAPQPITFLPHAADTPLFLTKSFGFSLIMVMYAYSGWNAAAYIVEEVRDPGKNLPRALIFGTAFVMVLYVAVNAVFLYTTPLTDMSGKEEVAHVAGVQIFGSVGERVVSGLICVGLVANVSAMMWVGSRVSEAIGTTYPVLGWLAKTSSTRVPYIALIYQFIVVQFLLIFNLDRIITYVESVLIFWSILAVFGVIVLRIREPELPRPYRTFGYPFTPLIFIGIAFFILVQTYKFHPHQTLAGAATVLIGIPIYLWASRNVPEKQLRGEEPPAPSPYAS